MAGTNDAPKGLDEFLANIDPSDIDPQSAMAAKGMDPLVAQADQNLQNQYNVALQASQVNPATGEVGTPEANQALADQSLNVAMATVKAPEPKMVPKGTFKNKFNIEAYHGTKADIEEFTPDALGASTGAPSAKKAYFFAEDPSTASDYANLSNSRFDLRKTLGEAVPKAESGLTQLAIEEELKSLQRSTPKETKSYIKNLNTQMKVVEDELAGKLPTYKSYDGTIRTAIPRPKNYLLQKLDDYKIKIANAQAELLPEAQDARLAKIEELQNRLEQSKTYEAQQHTGQNVIPVRLRMENPYIHDFKGQSYRDEPYSAILDKAKAAGHDGVIFQNTFDPADPNNRVMQNIYAVFEPHQIRSRFAEFNPKQAKSGKLSYAHGGMVQGYAEGGEVPAGLDAFIAEPAQQPMDQQGASTAPGSVPEGLDEFVAPILNEEKYGTPLEMAKTAAEGLAKGAAGPVATGIETALFDNAKEQRAREEANPITHAVSEAAGFGGSLLTGVGEGALVAKAGEAALQATKLVDAASLSAKITAGAVRGATELGLLDAGDQVSQLIRQDPGTSLDTAIAHVGLYGVLGGAAGGAAFSTISPLWKATAGKLPQVLEDFKGQMYTRSGASSTAETLQEELQAHYDKLAKPINVAIQDSEDLDLRAVQKGSDKINKAYDKFQDSISGFDKHFTKKVTNAETGEITKAIDPEKVQNYILKPSEKATNELKSFLKSSEKYEDTVNQVHTDLGVESPIQPSSLSAVKGSLEEPGVGSKMADYLIDNFTGEKGAEKAGLAVGGYLGHMTGIPGGEVLGGWLGKEAITPFFKTVLPSIVKPLLEKASNATGFKAAAEFGAAVVKGEKLMAESCTNVFEGKGSSVLPDSAIPNPKTIEKLKELVESSATDPKEMLEVGNSPLGHYLPDHGVALGSMAAGAMAYLNSLRPNTTQAAPLDSKIVPNSSQKAEYHNALMIAQQPLLVLDKVKAGTITPNDLKAAQVMYPSLYKSLTTKLSANMIEHVNKGKIVPYKTRIGLSMFLAQPLDSTLTPNAIIQAQPINKQQQNQQPTNQRITPSAAATSQIAKLSNLYQTPNQSSQRRAQKTQ